MALGISGSIAAVESVRLARDLMRQGAEVHAVLTRAARRLVTPASLRWATGNPVVTRLGGRVEHVEMLGDEGFCDLLLVAPATAATVAKIALALDDTPVTTMATTALGAGRPVLVAPGMHDCMYRHPVVQEHLRKLEQIGVVLVAPRLAEGKAKMAPPVALVEAVAAALGPRDLLGRRVLITAGPTREALDPVRFVSNRSSGRMGVELAREASRRGAAVTLVYGPGEAEPPAGARVLRVETAAEMAAAVEAELRAHGCHAFLGAAAVADFAPVQASDRKIPTRDGDLELKLAPTPKVLDRVRSLAPEALVVGFKAEAGGTVEDLQQAARRKLQEARADLVLANQVALADRGFDAPTNEFWLVDAEGPAEHLPLASKASLARLIWDRLAPRVAG